VGTWSWSITYLDEPGNPLTPQNTGKTETFIYNSDKTWRDIVNNVAVDSGTYAVFPINRKMGNYTYDSIAYYKNNIQTDWDGYRIDGDTLYVGKDVLGYTVGGWPTVWIRQY
jgi:hypothetical protein